MPDLSCTYTLTTPAATISLNDGDLRDGTDKYWIQNIQGLDGPSLRTPIDNAPQTDGGLVHPFFKGPRHIVFEGILVTESAGWPSAGDACIMVQNQMEEDLITALVSIIAADGTLDWAPLGLSARSLTVRHDLMVEFTAIENYALKQFVFGLVAADPDWIESS